MFPLLSLLSYCFKTRRETVVSPPLQFDNKARLPREVLRIRQLERTPPQSSCHRLQLFVFASFTTFACRVLHSCYLPVNRYQFSPIRSTHLCMRFWWSWRGSSPRLPRRSQQYQRTDGIYSREIDSCQYPRSQILVRVALRLWTPGGYTLASISLDIIIVGAKSVLTINQRLRMNEWVTCNSWQPL